MNEAAATSTSTSTGSRLSDYLQLTKPRLSLLVLATTAAGFVVANVPGTGGRLVIAMIGTLLVVGGANALNQVYEREVDALMRRTRTRPLPAGRLWARPAGAFGVAIAVLGAAILALLVNPLSAALAAAGFLLYVFAYTPLKRISRLSTLVGAIPGAVPPMIGWTAATGNLDLRAAALFAILFVWQMPHFLALARLFREDYRRASMVMPGVLEGDGPMAYRHMIAYCIALLPTSASLTYLGVTGSIYLFGALLLGLGFLTTAIQASRQQSRKGDRRAFLFSIIYLPGLLVLMILDRQLL